jgi:glycogen synthase
MFGWEFPPTITGGLGMACYGLTRHLALAQVNISFVLPHVAEEMRHFFLEVIDGSSFLDQIKLKVDQQEIAKKRENNKQYSHLYEHIAIDALLAPYSSTEYYKKIIDQLRMEGGYGQELMDEVKRYALSGLEVAKSREFDLIHVHDWMSFVVGVKVKQEFDKPLIVHLHTSEYDRNPTEPNHDIVVIEQKAFDAADKITCEAFLISVSAVKLTFRCNRLLLSEKV